MEKDRQEIVDWLLQDGLVERCVAYQTNKAKNAYLKEEMLQETWLWILTYDLDKLKNAYDNKHMNALLTRYIRNQWFSKTSPFYKTFRKFDLLTDELQPEKDEDEEY